VFKKRALLWISCSKNILFMTFFLLFFRVMLTPLRPLTATMARVSVRFLTIMLSMWWCCAAQANNSRVQTDSIAPLVVSGHVDMYYRYSSRAVGALTFYTPAARGFGLGMANVQISKDNGKVGFMADLMFGTRAEQTNYNYSTNPSGQTLSSSQTLIKQLYVTYQPTAKLKLTLGNFTTFFGSEMVEASSNLNYSMSYTFTNSPFHHTGIKAEYTFSDHWTALVGVFNRTDWKLDTTNRKFVGGQLAYVNGKFKVMLNALTGADLVNVQTNTFDLTATYQATPKLGLGFNITDKTAAPEGGKSISFIAETLYLNYATSDRLTLAARLEHFDDKEAVAAIGADIVQFTLSGNLKLDALNIIPEIRFDNANNKIFNNEKSDFSFLLAGVYKF
jgi:Putative beta-barrel porin-2, OmpL-like. bbp2